MKGGQNWVKQVRIYKLPVIKINKSWGYNVHHDDSIMCVGVCVLSHV